MMFTAGLTLVVVGFVMVALNLYGTWLSLRHFSSGLVVNGLENRFAPVSILKPLKGADNGIIENLDSFFRLDYPHYELIFSVADHADPACALVKRLIDRYPNVQACLIVGDVDVGPNPKVNNLIRSYKSAANDLILISDSNVRVEPGYLKHVVSHLDADTGIVTAAVTGQSPKGFGGHLEAIYLNTFYARWMATGSSFGFPMVLGKSMLFRKTTASRFGGIQNLARYLAEDYMAGLAMQQLGMKVKVMTDPVPQIIGRHTFKAFWQRHVRWGRMRKCQAPLALLGEPFSGPILSGLIAAWGLYGLFGLSPVAFLGWHLGVWFACDLLVMKRLRTELTFLLPIRWFVREILAVPLWIHILAGNTVSWRGSKYRLEAGGVLAGSSQS